MQKSKMAHKCKCQINIIKLLEINVEEYFHDFGFLKQGTEDNNYKKIKT